MRSLGADQAIDYNAEDFTKIGQVCDAVFETVGGDVATKSYAVLKPGGRAAFIASGRQGAADRAHRRAGLAPAGAAHPRRDGARRGIVRRRARSARPRSSSTSLPQAADAHRVSEGRHFRGKLVFQVR